MEAGAKIGLFLIEGSLSYSLVYSINNLFLDLQRGLAQIVLIKLFIY